MRFLVILALVVLAVAYIRADEATKLVNKEVVKQSAEPKIGRCTEACALKTLMVDDENVLKSFVKLFVEDEEKDKVDELLASCDKGPDVSEENCEDYFTCIENEFENKNITFIFGSNFLGSKK